MGEKITDADLLHEIIWEEGAERDGIEYEHVVTEDGDDGRWRRQMSTVFKRMSDGKLFIAHWQKGLTENCDHEYPDEAYEVVAKTKTVEVTEYVLKD